MIDPIDVPKTPELLANAGNYFDGVVLFGTELMNRPDTKANLALTNHQFSSYKELIAQAPRFHGLVIEYSGEGFVPVCDPHGDIFTAFGNVDRVTGTFSELCILNTADVSYIKPGVVEIDEDEIFESSVLIQNPEVQNMLEFKKLLGTAPEGFQVFIEFVVKHVVGVDEPVRGHSVRVPEYHVIHSILASSLEIHDICPKRVAKELVEPYEIPKALKYTSDRYRQTIRSKSFRNLPLEVQQRKVEKFITSVNETLALDRFIMRGQPHSVYVPDMSAESGFEYCENATPFIAECLRFDCIETKQLSEGKKIQKRRGNVNSVTSTCVVVQIDDEARERLGVESSVLWIPVTNQLNAIEFVEEGLFR